MTGLSHSSRAVDRSQQRGCVQSGYMKSCTPIAHFVILMVVLLPAFANTHLYHNISKRAVTRPWTLTTRQKTKILDKHNELRREVKPVASNMLKMKWNDDLERLATDYSRRCLFDHNDNRQVSGMGYIGENIYISSASQITDEFGAYAVIAWDDEKQYYSYYTRACQKSKVCGHYTQTAWAKSELVGCGMSTCDAVNVFGKMYYDSTLVVCNYSPGGNVQGQRIYENGGPCSKCPEGYWCDDWLCTNFSAKIGISPIMVQLIIVLHTLHWRTIYSR